MAHNPRPIAIPIAVSRALGEYRDENGDGLPKAEIVRTPYGPEEFGGYRVTRGTARGTVLVRWITPDAMDDPAEIERLRGQYLNAYARALRAKGFTVTHHSYGLSVQRVYKD
jgi:hypothetical protein